MQPKDKKCNKKRAVGASAPDSPLKKAKRGQVQSAILCHSPSKSSVQKKGRKRDGPADGQSTQQALAAEHDEYFEQLNNSIDQVGTTFAKGGLDVPFLTALLGNAQSALQWFSKPVNISASVKKLERLNTIKDKLCAMKTFAKIQSKKSPSVKDFNDAMIECDRCKVLVPVAYKDRQTDALWKAALNDNNLREGAMALIHAQCEACHVIDKLQGVLLGKISLCKPLKDGRGQAFTDLDKFLVAFENCLDWMSSQKSAHGVAADLLKVQYMKAKPLLLCTFHTQHNYQHLQSALAAIESGQTSMKEDQSLHRAIAAMPTGQNFVKACKSIIEKAEWGSTKTSSASAILDKVSGDVKLFSVLEAAFSSRVDCHVTLYI